MKTKIDGTLTAATKIQMWWSGLKIRLFSALAGAIIGAGILFSFSPQSRWICRSLRRGFS